MLLRSRSFWVLRRRRFSPRWAQVSCCNAAGLFWTARRQPIPDAAAWAAIVLDLGWVVGSVALIEVGVLSPIGTGLVALVAAVVLIFAGLQFVGVRQMPRSA